MKKQAKQHFAAAMALVLAVVLFCGETASAQLVLNSDSTTQTSLLQPKTTYIAADISFGGILLEDEYLSPLRYGGTNYGLNLTVEAPLTRRLPLMWRLASALDFANTKNPAGSAITTFYRGELQSEVLYRFNLPYGIRLAAGGGLRTTFGARLHSSNVNNPATIDLKADFTASLLAAYMLPVRAFPATVRLYANFGLLGMGHRLGYGQSYYEKHYLDGGLVKAFNFTHPGNTQYSSLVLAFDLPIVNFCTLRVGYRLDADHSRLNQRITSSVLHGGFVGFSFETHWFTGRKALLSPDRRPVLFPDKTF